MKYFIKYTQDIESALQEFCEKLRICNLRSQENLMIVFNDLDTTKSSFSEYIQNYTSLDWTKGHTLAHHLHTRPNQIPTRLSDNTKEGFLNPSDDKNKLGVWKSEDNARYIIISICQNQDMKDRIIKHFLTKEKGTFKTDTISNIRTSNGISFQDMNDNTEFYVRSSSSIYCYYVDNNINYMKEFDIHTGQMNIQQITDKFKYKVVIVLHYNEQKKEFWLETAFPDINLI